MKRVRTERRPDWLSIVEEQGLVFGTPALDAAGGDRAYWDESVHYTFSMDEVLSLEADVEVVHSMCLEAVEQVVLTERFRDFAIPEWRWQPSRRRGGAATRTSTAVSTCATTAARPAKLLEYNADTPTTLLESPRSCSGTGCRTCSPATTSGTRCTRSSSSGGRSCGIRCPATSFTSRGRGADPTGEDHVTVGYLQETAAEAGFETIGLSIEDVGWDSSLERFVDLEEHRLPRCSSSTRGSGCSPTTSASTCCQPAEDAVARAAVEDAAVEQGAAGGPVGDVSRPPEPAARLPR